MFSAGFPEETPQWRCLTVLAGEMYVASLLEDQLFDPFPFGVKFPFQEQDFDGLGE